MQESIFSNNSSTEEVVDYVEVVKKKFSKQDGSLDVDALVKGKAEADNYIETIKKQKDEMRATLDQLQVELQSRSTVEDSLSKLLKQGTSNIQNTNVNEERPAPITQNQQTFSRDELAAMVREALTTESTKAQKANNLKESRELLEKSIGPNFVTHLEKRASELGVSKEFLDKLATESPKALMSLVVTQSEQVGSFTPPSSSVRNTAPNTGRNYKYYENIRKTNPKEYFSARVQTEMHKEASRLGPDFYK